MVSKYDSRFRQESDDDFQDFERNKKTVSRIKHEKRELKKMLNQFNTEAEELLNKLPKRNNI